MKEILFERFEVLKELHNSLNSTIYIVYDSNSQENNDKQFVLKVFNKKSKPSFRKHEIQILKHLLKYKNEFVPKYIDHDLSDLDNPKWLALEYFENSKSIEARKGEIQNLKSNQRLSLFNRILEAYASLNDVVHKDINPRNILVSEDFKNIKIVDFGASRLFASGSEKVTGSYEAHDQYYGEYVSPEEKNLDSYDINSHTDIFKLGILFHQILTGFSRSLNIINKKGFTNVNVSKLKKDIGGSGIDATLVEPISEIISKCLNIDPSDRYDHPINLKNELDKKIEESKNFSSYIRNIISSKVFRNLSLGIVGVIIIFGGYSLLSNENQITPPFSEKENQITPPPSEKENQITPPPSEKEDGFSDKEESEELESTEPPDLTNLKESESEKLEKKEFEDTIEKLESPPILNIVCTEEPYQIDQGQEFQYQDCFEYKSANEGDSHAVKVMIDNTEELNVVASNNLISGKKIFSVPGEKNIKVTLINQNGIEAEIVKKISVINVIPEIIDLQEKYEVEKDEDVEFVFYYNDPGIQDSHNARIKWTETSPWKDINVENGIIKVSNKFQSGGEYEVTIGIKDQYSDWSSEPFLVSSSVCGQNEKPGRPGKPFIEPYGSDGIKVAWAKSKCIGDNGTYQVIEKNNLLNKSETQDNSISFNNLKPGTYQFIIIALNTNGNSLDSLENYWIEEFKFFPIKNFLIRNDNANKLTLNWDYQNYLNDNICFNIYRFGNIVNNLPVCNLTYTDQNLLAGNSYSYQMSPYSRSFEIEGPKSEVKSAIAKGLPGIPNINLEYLPGNDIKVNLFSINNGGFENVRFNIFRNEILIKELSYGDNTFIDQNKGDGLEYFYDAVALNELGKSSRSNKLSKIHHGNPGKPTLTISATEEELNLKWQKVSDGGSNLIYEIREYGTGKKIGSDISSESNEITFTINEETYGSSLSSDIEYSFYVRAKNIKGFYKDSEKVSAKPKEKDTTKLEIPTSFQVIKNLYGNECYEFQANDESGVRIKWNSDWSKFNVFVDGDMFKENWSSNQVDICSLKNGKQYEIKIIATQSSGFLEIEDSNPLTQQVDIGRIPTYGEISPIMTFTKIDDVKFWVDLGFSAVNLYGQSIIDHEVRIFKSGSQIPGSPFTNNEGQSRWEVNYECGINYDAQVRVKVAWDTGWSNWSPKHGNYKIDCPKLDTPTSFNVNAFLGKDECGVPLGYSGVRIGWQSDPSVNSFKVDVSPKPNSGVWPRIVNGKTLDVCDLRVTRPYDISITAVDSLYEDSDPLTKTIYPGQKPTWESNPISFSEHESGKYIKMTIGQPYSNLISITKKEIRIYANGQLISSENDGKKFPEAIDIGGNQSDWQFDYTCGVTYDAEVRAHVNWGPNFTIPGGEKNKAIFETVWSDWSQIHGNYKIDCPPIPLPSGMPLLKSDIEVIPFRPSIGTVLGFTFKTNNPGGWNINSANSIIIDLKNSRDEIVSIPFYEQNILSSSQIANPLPSCNGDICEFNTFGYAIPDDLKWRFGGNFRFHQLRLTNGQYSSTFTSSQQGNNVIYSNSGGENPASSTHSFKLDNTTDPLDPEYFTVDDDDPFKRGIHHDQAKSVPYLWNFSVSPCSKGANCTGAVDWGSKVNMSVAVKHNNRNGNVNMRVTVVYDDPSNNEVTLCDSGWKNNVMDLDHSCEITAGEGPLASEGTHIFSYIKMEDNLGNIAWYYKTGGWKIKRSTGYEKIYGNGIDNFDLHCFREVENQAWDLPNCSRGIRTLNNVTVGPPPIITPIINTNSITFTSNRDGNYEIYVMNENGSNQFKVTDNPSNDKNPSWSPDKTKIVFNSNRDGTPGQIYILNLNDLSVDKLTSSFENTHPIWSPNGDKIAYVSQQGENLSAQIFILNLNTGLINQLTFMEIPNSDPSVPTYARDPQWSPNGDKIIFRSPVYYDGKKRNEVFSINVNGDPNLTQITRFPNPSEYENYSACVHHDNPSFNPSGTKILFQCGIKNNPGDGDGKFYGNPDYYQIFIMNSDGSNHINLSNNSYSDTFPRWSPDGNKIVFYSNRLGTGNDEIFVMDYNGNNQNNISNNSNQDNAPDW